MIKKRFIKYKAVAIAQKITKGLNNVSKVAEAVTKVGKDPTATNVAAIGVLGLNQLVNHFAENTERPNKPAMENLFHATGLLAHALQMNKTINETNFSGWKIQAKEMESGGIVTHWCQGSNHSFYIDGTTSESVIKEARYKLWAKYGTRINLTVDSDSEFDQVWNVMSHTLGQNYPSDLSRKIVKALRVYFDKEFHRSLVLHGVPGTGKSTMARAITEEFKFPTLFLTGDDLRSLGVAGLESVCKFLEPGCVIIDDLDRLTNAHSFLDEIESLKKSVKLVLITVNDFKKLGTALLRPGRIDEFIEVNRVFMADTLVPELSAHPEFNKEISTWPIAFIEEFKIRIKVLGLEKALETLDLLRNRVERNNIKDNLVPNDFDLEKLLELSKK